ncbi:hypothetical protein Q7P37_009831 [Cladosporium fusiforme]
MASSKSDTEKLVSDVCDRNAATSLLEDFFKHPRETEPGKQFSATVNGAILRNQHALKDTKNLLLPMNRVRYIFASYINSCQIKRHMSEAAKTLEKSRGPNSTRQAYEEVKRNVEEDQKHFKCEWDSLVDGKGYPPSWKAMFVEHAKLQTEDDASSFDPSYLEDLRQGTFRELMANLLLRDEVWGNTGLTYTGHKGVTSWDWEWALNNGGLFAKEGRGAGGVST